MRQRPASRSPRRRSGRRRRTRAHAGRHRARQPVHAGRPRVRRRAAANTVIRAPFTGTVVRKMAEVGESVAPIPPGVNISTASGAIVALADLDTLEVEVDVSRSQRRAADERPAGRGHRRGLPGSSDSDGVLRQVIPTADRTKATVLIKVTILDKDKKLKPEMSAKVTFVDGGGAAGAVRPRRKRHPGAADGGRHARRRHPGVRSSPAGSPSRAR